MRDNRTELTHADRTANLRLSVVGWFGCYTLLS
jgi:hypothetical protein